MLEFDNIKTSTELQSDLRKIHEEAIEALRNSNCEINEQITEIGSMFDRLSSDQLFYLNEELRLAVLGKQNEALAKCYLIRVNHNLLEKLDSEMYSNGYEYAFKLASADNEGFLNLLRSIRLLNLS